MRQAYWSSSLPSIGGLLVIASKLCIICQQGSCLAFTVKIHLLSKVLTKKLFFLFNFLQLFW